MLVARTRNVLASGSQRAFMMTKEWNPPPPEPVRRLRPPSTREIWLDKITRLGYPTAHLSLAGGYIHQTLFEILQQDAQTLKLKFIFHSIHDLEVNILTPALRRICQQEGLSGEGDYVELRNRLKAHTDIFAQDVKPETE